MGTPIRSDHCGARPLDDDLRARAEGRIIEMMHERDAQLPRPSRERVEGACEVLACFTEDPTPFAAYMRMRQRADDRSVR